MRFGIVVEAITRWWKLRIRAGFGSNQRAQRAVPRTGSRRSLARRYAALLLTVSLAWAPLQPHDVHAETTSGYQRERSFSPYAFGLNMRAEDKAAIYLDLHGVPTAQIASMLGTVQRTAMQEHIDEAYAKLRKRILAFVGNAANDFELASAEVAVVQEAVDDLYKGLSPVPTVGGVDLTTLLENPNSGVRVYGLSGNTNEIAPLVVMVPAGVLAPGTPLSLAVPVVLSPTRDNVQRMAVTDARHLFTRPDGGSVYVLKSYCLDEHADAPTRRGGDFRFSKEDQALLTPRIRDALKSGSGQSLQHKIWEIQKSAP